MKSCELFKKRFLALSDVSFITSILSKLFDMIELLENSVYKSPSNGFSIVLCNKLSYPAEPLNVSIEVNLTFLFASFNFVAK